MAVVSVYSAKPLASGDHRISGAVDGHPLTIVATLPATPSMADVEAALLAAYVPVSDFYTAVATITRPANTTPYTGGDVLGGAISFPAIGPYGGRVKIASVSLEARIAAVPAGMTTMFLHLYNVTPPSALADNAAFDLPAGDRASYLGSIAMGTLVDQGATLYIGTDNVDKQIQLLTDGVFGYLVSTAGFTPAANSEVYKATLHAQAA